MPGRLVSERLPHKLLADLGGEPVLVRTLQVAAKSGADRVIAAVDNQLLQTAAEQAGFEAVLTGEHNSGTERIAAVAEQLKLTGTIVNLQGDEPLMAPQLVAQIAQAAKTATHCATAAVAMPATELTDSVVWVVTNQNSRALYFSRAKIPHGATELRAHLGIYGFTNREVLIELANLPSCELETTEKLEQLRWLWHGYQLDVITTEQFYLGVNTAEDLAAARNQFTSQ